jgi:DNA-directed RNA polymerase specialized sigma subunit
MKSRMYRGKSQAEWARVLGISRERVRQLMNKGLLEARINAGSSETAWERRMEQHQLQIAERMKEADEVVAKAFSSDKTTQEIADQLGMTCHAVSRALKRLGLQTMGSSRTNRRGTSSGPSIQATPEPGHG